MSTAQETSNKATVRRFVDVVSTGDAEVISKTIDELVESDVLIHMPLPIQATGAQALKQVWAMLLRGLPDLHVAVEDVIAEGDKVVSRNTVTGTHQGEYRGLPPTGKSVTYNEILIFALPAGESRRSGGRRRPLADATARRDSRLSNLTGSGQEDRQGRKPMSDPQAIADRVQIEALRGEFTDAAMMRDWDRFASLFTHQGEYRGLPPTGKTVTTRSI